MSGGAKGLKIRLRPTDEDDLEFVIRAERSKENCRFVCQQSLEKHREALASSDVAHLLIESLTDRKPVGYVILAGLRNEHRAIEFRRIVVTEKREGYGGEALRLVMHMAFTQLGAHRLWLDVKESNMRARSLYEREGFTSEGTLRESIKTGEGWESLIIMSMLQSEYGDV